MPIIVCLAIAGVFYYLLSGVINDRDKSHKYFKKAEEICKCHSCSKEIDTNWRYCPFCGHIDEGGVNID